MTLVFFVVCLLRTTEKQQLFKMTKNQKLIEDLKYELEAMCDYDAHIGNAWFDCQQTGETFDFDKEVDKLNTIVEELNLKIKALTV